MVVDSSCALLSGHQRDAFVLATRNLEVLSNEDLGSNPKDVGSMAAALQCQVWVQFDNHTNFCKALHAFCGRAMQKARYIMPLFCFLFLGSFFFWLIVFMRITEISTESTSSW
jgi:hypothetical protein